MIIRNARYVFTGSTVSENQDIEIIGNRISRITAAADDGNRPETGDAGTEAIELDGRRFAVLPSFKNAHTHAAMTLLRGIGDDMKLQPWLETKIWPVEALLTEEDVYWGTRLAALEMIQSGTTFANDMYFHAPEIISAFTDARMKAAVGLALFDFSDPEKRRREIATAQELLERFSSLLPGNAQTPPVYLVVAPHSIYTCSKELLQWSRRVASDAHTVLHIHMSETELEVENAVREFGKRPFSYAAELGLTGPDMIAAHAIWLDGDELDIVTDSGLTVAHNPASNMKLSSGAFPYREYADRGVPMMLAPDGVASNNSLDMFDEMKLASLLQKHHFRDPERLPALAALQLATGGFSSVFPGISGTLAPGEPADLICIDLDHPQMVPVHNLVSNLVYAASSGAVDTVVCDGRILMQDRTVPGSEEVISNARRCAADLARRAARD